MAEFGGEGNKVTGVFGGIQFENNGQGEQIEDITGNIGEETVENAGTIRNYNKKLPVKTGFWQRFKAFWLQEIDWNREIRVELTPAQQKVEDEINEFLHQEVTWGKVRDFLFQDVSFGKKGKQ